MSDAQVWLTDDGELEEVRAVLEGAGVSVSREIGEIAGTQPFVLGSSRRLRAVAGICPRAVCIEVIGADDPAPDPGGIWLRRPVDPHAVRALMDAVRFGGTEQRWSPRAAIGRPVRFASRHGVGKATLVDLSVDGCRLATRRALDEGSRVALWLPAPPGRRAGRRVLARVVRHEPALWDHPTDHGVSLVFTSVSLGARRALQALLEHHAGARLSPRPPAPMRVEIGTDAADRDRRRGERHVFDRRVIIRRDEGPAVLRGRDLSLGGVRIEPSPGLSVGSVMQLAVHVKPGTTPLVLDARVTRDDAEDGLVLQFQDLDDRQRDYLCKMLGELEPKDRADAEVEEAAEG